jgi:hypothetical protein
MRPLMMAISSPIQNYKPEQPTMKCAIQWIDDAGKPTPDDNNAVALIQCMGYGFADNPSYKPTPSKIFPCCAKHLIEMPQDGVWRIVARVPMSRDAQRAAHRWMRLLTVAERHARVMNWWGYLAGHHIPGTARTPRNMRRAWRMYHMNRASFRTERVAYLAAGIDHQCRELVITVSN